jgi:hypothetical protein
VPSMKLGAASVELRGLRGLIGPFVTQHTTCF